MFIATEALASDFFQGKTIRLLVAYPVGGDTDTFSRLLALGMSKNLPGNPRVIVENKPGAGGALALNYLFNISSSEGLTLLGMGANAAMDQLTRPTIVKFDLGKFEYVGGAGPLLQTLAGRKELPIKTIADLGKLKRVVIAGGGPASTSTMAGRLIKRLYPNAVVTVGYLGENDRHKALLNGEADAAVLAARHLRGENTDLQPLVWIEGKAKDWTNTPSLGELNFPPETKSFLKVITAPTQYGRTYVAPPGTPKEQMALLQRAFELTLKDPQFLETASRMGADDLEWQSADEVRAAYLQVLATPSDALARLQGLLKE